MTAQPLTDRGRRTQMALVDAARKVFEAKGFDGTRMGDIAEAAGVSHGTVYTWFDTKEAVLAAVADSTIAELYEGMRTPSGATALDRIARANRSYLDTYRDHARLLEVVEQASMTHPEFRTLLADLRATHVKRVSGTIGRLQSDGLATASLDQDIAAAALCAMVEGFARHWFGRGEIYDETQAVDTLTALWAAALSLQEEK
ncbi:MAG: TetR/AcrR family transcriptional regulator [Candidatus Nanopelagicales bacterium]|jgi:AcrR family transcriptional regulator